MAQTNLFSYLEEQKPIGKIVIDRRLLLSMLQTMDDVNGNFNYYVGSGIWYAINTLEQMAVFFRSKALSVDADKKKYFTVNAYKIKELVKITSKDNVEITIYDGAVSVFSSRISRAFVTYKDETTKVLNVNNILKSNNYIKVKVPVDKLVDAIKWIKGTGKVKHSRATFLVKGSKLSLYDYDVDKNGKFDEAKAVISSVVESEDVSATFNVNYLDIMSKFLSKNKDSIKSMHLYLCTDCPLIVRGKIGLEGKMKDVSSDLKFDFVIAPIVEFA